jgi:hypothetical protein
MGLLLSMLLRLMLLREEVQLPARKGTTAVATDEGIWRCLGVIAVMVAVQQLR